MPKSRPQLSITLPRDFTFHYTEGEQPKTPEQDDKTPAAAPSPPHPYKVKRRPRPSIQTLAQARLTELQNAPVPMIETRANEHPLAHQTQRPSVEHRMTEPADGLLAPAPVRSFMTLPRPRTPTLQRVQLSDYYCKTPPPKDLGEEIIRPLSRCSIISDSSDVSSGSITSYPSMGGSCTSPDSDTADPFILPKIKRDNHTRKSAMPKSRGIAEASQDYLTVPHKQPSVQWTPEMDKHLWSTYLQYLQDPTVTPFKTLPGSAPPLGVCHRVARLARRNWRGSQSRISSPGSTGKGNCPGFSATISSVLSGSSTPTRIPVAEVSIWPKSSSSTRRRLRLLAKKKPSIAPHYQRLLRSPSPFSSSSQSRSERASSPLCQEQTAFSTRDIQFSLTTSTAATMQPDGYLAQLGQGTSVTPKEPFQQPSDPPVPWASPPPIPSSAIPSSAIPTSDFDGSNAFGAPNAFGDPFTGQTLLGSPFSGSHTWGPSRSRQQVRPKTPRAQTGLTASTMGPSLKSPLRFNHRNPYPSVSKRRAQHQLEEELSPGGSEKHENLIDQLFSGHTEGRHRRVRSRGFSLGDVNGSNRLESLFRQAHAEQPMNVQEQTPQASSSTSGMLRPPDAGDSIRRLGSPFALSGGKSMPTRRPTRHLASASLSAFDPSNFASIDQRIRGTDLDEDFLRKLRE